MPAILRAKRLPGQALILVGIAMALMREAALHPIEAALVKQMPWAVRRGNLVR
jgi:hypothetical protein